MQFYFLSLLSLHWRKGLNVLPSSVFFCTGLNQQLIPNPVFNPLFAVADSVALHLVQHFSLLNTSYTLICYAINRVSNLSRHQENNIQAINSYTLIISLTGTAAMEREQNLKCCAQYTLLLIIKSFFVDELIKVLLYLSLIHI